MRWTDLLPPTPEAPARFAGAVVLSVNTSEKTVTLDVDGETWKDIDYMGVAPSVGDNVLLLSQGGWELVLSLPK